MNILNFSKRELLPNWIIYTYIGKEQKCIKMSIPHFFFVDSKLENINYIIRKNSFKKIICNYSFNHRKSTTQVVWGSEKIVTDSGHRWQQKCLIWFELYLRKLHFTFTKKLWIYIFFFSYRICHSTLFSKWFLAKRRKYWRSRSILDQFYRLFYCWCR